MAKRRQMKKAINLMCADLLVECLAVQQTNKNIPADDVENIAKSILLMQEDFISRLSHVDKHQVRRFFDQLTDDLTVATNEIVDHIFHLS
jgi:hypothetical protein